MLKILYFSFNFGKYVLLSTNAGAKMLSNLPEVLQRVIRRAEASCLSALQSHVSYRQGSIYMQHCKIPHYHTQFTFQWNYNMKLLKKYSEVYKSSLNNVAL